MQDRARTITSFDDEKRRVLDATDIVRLISESVSLKRKGREYVGLCPFHDDHTPSMSVVPHKQIYKCFSCGAGGDALSFVQQYHRMTFPEALSYLAEQAGIKLTPRKRSESGREESGSTVDQGDERAALLSANATALGFFRTILEHPEHGATARELLERRGISAEMILCFGLGAAPNRWDGLSMTIAGKQMGHTAFLAAGLLKTRDSGGQYDAFRHRLMFPIQDQLGRVIAFGGRRIDDEDEPKYLNSSDSQVFDKSGTLYGLPQALQSIRSKRVAIVTEGYMDTIACHQAGFTNTVATLGTALTRSHARVLKRICDTVVLLFDGDDAGKKAAERAVEVFFAEPIDVRIAALRPHTNAKDPDELLKREDGRSVFQRVLDAAADPVDLLFERVREDLGGTGLSGKARVVEGFVQRLVQLGLGAIDRVRYQLLVRKLAAVSGVGDEAVFEIVGAAVAKARQRSDLRSDPRTDAAKPERLTPRSPEEHLLACVLCDGNLASLLDGEERALIAPHAYSVPSLRELARTVGTLMQQAITPHLQAVLPATEDEDVKRAAATLAHEVERITGGTSDGLHRHWQAQLIMAIRNRVAPAGSIADPSESLDRIVALRAATKRIGGDPRKIPKPVGGSP